MGFSKWLLKKGAIGGATRLMIKAYRKQKETNPELSDSENFKNITKWRYETNGRELDSWGFDKAGECKNLRDYLTFIVGYERMPDSLGLVGAIREVVDEICDEEGINWNTAGCSAQSLTANTTTANTTIVTADTISDYTKRLDEHNVFRNEWQNLINKYKAISNDLLDRFSKAATYEERMSITKEMHDNDQKCLDESLELKVPGSAKEEYSHWLEVTNQSIIAESCMLNNDSAGYAAAVAKVNTETDLITKETVKTMEDFNKEAERLSLPQPFDTSQMQ